MKLRAERRAGQLLKEMDKNLGAAATLSNGTMALPTLADMGIKKSAASH